MKIFLDTSDTDIISKHCETGLIDGVTTNPTLMMQAGRDPVEVLRDIMPSFYNKNASISAEVVGETAEEMVLQSEKYRSVSNKITIKVPCTVEGLKACRILSDMSIPVNVTLIFSVEQAILAYKSGASYVSPFIGRCEDNNIDGIGLISSINKFITNPLSDLIRDDIYILAASIRNVSQVVQAFEAGADIVTLPPSIFEQMYHHDLTDQGLAQFDKDWKELNK